MSRVRPALVEDAARLGEIHVMSWQAAYAGILAPAFLSALSVTSREDWWTERLATGYAQAEVLVVENDGRVVGFASVGPSREAIEAHPARESKGELHAIYLSPESFGLGLGRKLMASSEACLIDLGYDEAILWVIDANTRARRFYEAAGWNVEGALKLEEIGGIQVTELRYRKRLANSVQRPASSE